MNALLAALLISQVTTFKAATNAEIGQYFAATVRVKPTAKSCRLHVKFIGKEPLNFWLTLYDKDGFRVDFVRSDVEPFAYISTDSSYHLTWQSPACRSIAKGTMDAEPMPESFTAAEMDMLVRQGRARDVRPSDDEFEKYRTK